MATELEACRQLADWSERVGGAYEKKIASAYIGEVARTLRGGVDLGACENIALSEIGLTESDIVETHRCTNRHCIQRCALERRRLSRDRGRSSRKPLR